MVHLLYVAEFVNDHAVKHFGRSKHQKRIKTQIACRRAAAPARPLFANGYFTVFNADGGRKICHTFRYMFFCRGDQLFEFGFRKLSDCCKARAAFFDLFLCFFYPTVFVFMNE